MTDEIVFIMIMCFMFGFLFGGMFGRHRDARAAYKQGLYDGKVRKLLNWDNWFDDIEDFRKLEKILKENSYEDVDKQKYGRRFEVDNQ